MKFTIHRTTGREPPCIHAKYEDNEYTITISSLEALGLLADEVESELILSFEYKPDIEIYDTYRE